MSDSEIAGGSDSAEKSVRILVVDDHQIVRQGLVKLLNQVPGLDVVGEAADGEEAVEKALALGPAVVIMDITMPKMNGIQATERLSELQPSAHIIGLSLHEFDDMGEAMLKAGAAVYLNKNSPIDELIDAINRIAP